MANSRKKRNPFRFLTRKFPKRMQKKLVLLFLLIVLVFVGLLGRVVYLNAEKGILYKKQVLNRQNYDSQTLPYRRGDILASDGTRLATSEKVYNVILDAYALDNEKKSVQKATKQALARCFGIKGSEVDQILKSSPGSRYSVLMKEVSYEAGQKFMTMKNEENSKIKAIWLENDYIRKYTYGSLACDVIGFIGNDNSGSYGLEAYYDDILSGVNGRTYGYLNSEANLERSTKEAEDGKSIVTTIDLGLQEIVEKHVKKFNKGLRNNATKGLGSKNTGVIVMDPNTGEILAEASYPDFDLNNPRDLSEHYGDDEWKAMTEDERLEVLQTAWRNFCVSDTFEPGSVVKPFTIAAGFESGTLMGNETYYCGGSLHVGDHDIKCHDGIGHGQLTLEEGIAKSCNVLLMNTSFAIGKENFSRYQRIFGFGQKTGIDLSGEASASSLIYTEDEMMETDLATNAFGQNFNATMTQVIAAFCSLINGGDYYRPHVVRQIVDSNGNVIENMNPEVIKKTVSKKTAETLREYMKGTVEYGTGQDADVEGYLLGGKTGTAEKLPRGTNLNTLSFIGFAPADDPEVVVYVVVDEPNIANQSKTSYVVELAQQIMSDVFPYLKITTVDGRDSSEEQEGSEAAGEGEDAGGDGAIAGQNNEE